MNKTKETNYLWNEMCKLDSAIKIELRNCKRNGKISEAYQNLCKDMKSAKEKYDKLIGSTAYNPMSYEHGERMTAKKVIGDLTGKTGPDTIHKLSD